MATQISIDVDNLTIKYRQPYVSEALNRKAKAGFGGILRGFLPKKDPNVAQKLLLDVDEQTGDSVMNIVNQGSPEFSIAWTLSSSLSVSVPNNAGYFHLYIDHGYIFGQDTNPSMTWFSTAEVIDSTVTKNGMYIVSVNGQDLDDIKTVFEISDTIALKRATASSYRGSRTRVQGYDENVLFQTDFSDWQYNPIDLNPERQNHCSMSVVPYNALPDGLLGTNLGSSDMDKIDPETNSCVLLAWRAAGDDTNANVDFAFDYKKRFVLPNIIPLNSQVSKQINQERKLKVAIRHCGNRNTGVRPVGETTTDKWHVRLNLSVVTKHILSDVTVGTETYKQLRNPTNLVTDVEIPFTPVGIGNDQYFPWSWAVGEISIPRHDGDFREFTIVGASVEIVVPNMRNDEFFAIDRLVIEGTNLALPDAFDSAHTVDNGRRFGAIDGDNVSRDTLLSGTTRSFDITPLGSWNLSQGAAQSIALDRVLHSVNIGLPLRDQDNLGRLEGQYEETAIFPSETHSPEGYHHLRNLFRQSNVNIYSTGQYQTRDLIAQYNAAGGNAPSSLKAPFRAGLTVHSGNVFALQSSSSVESNLSTTAVGNDNLTGAVIAEGSLVSGSDYVQRGYYDFDTGVLSPSMQSLTKVITGDNFSSSVTTALEVVNHPVVNGAIAPQTTSTSATYNNAVFSLINQTMLSPSSVVEDILTLRKITHYAMLACDKSQKSHGVVNGNIDPTKLDLPVVGARESLSQRTFGTLAIEDFVAERDIVRSISTETLYQNIGFSRSLSHLTRGNDITFDNTSLILTDSEGNVMTGGVRLYLGLVSFEPCVFSEFANLTTNFKAGEDLTFAKFLRFQRDWDDNGYYQMVDGQLNLTDYTTDSFTTQTIMYNEPMSTLEGSRNHAGRYNVDSFGVTLWGQAAVVSTTDQTLIEDNSSLASMTLAQKHLEYWLCPVNNERQDVSNNLASAVALRYQAHTIANRNVVFEDLDQVVIDRYVEHEDPYIRHVYLKVRCEVNKATPSWGYDKPIAVAEVMYSLYDFVAISFGMIDSNLNLIADGEATNRLNNGLRAGVRAVLDLNGAVWQEYEGNTSESGRDSLQELKSQLTANNLDPDILDTSKYIHNFSVSTVFRSAYGSEDFPSHPLNIAPTINFAYLNYKASSL